MSAVPPGARSRLLRNPFFVIGVSPAADGREIEREATKVLGQLELGVESASSYRTPVGPGGRDADLVRWALGELRDPKKRFVHAMWAGLPAP
jgi:hypothetical protein